MILICFFCTISKCLRFECTWRRLTASLPFDQSVCGHFKWKIFTWILSSRCFLLNHMFVHNAKITEGIHNWVEYKSCRHLCMSLLHFCISASINHCNYRLVFSKSGKKLTLFCSNMNIFHLNWATINHSFATIHLNCIVPHYL